MKKEKKHYNLPNNFNETVKKFFDYLDTVITNK